MEIANYDKSPGNWDSFCASASNASPFNTRLWHEYMRKYSRILQEDLSFAVLDEHKNPIALVPLFLEKKDINYQFSYADGFLRAPVIDPSAGLKIYKKTESAIFEIIEQKAKHCNALKYMCLIDPLSQRISGEQYNWLMKYGFLDCSLNTQIIDLNLDLKQLHEMVRKSYTSLINNGYKNYKCEIFDHNNCNFDIHELYRNMHHKAAGRVTRSIETFKLQFEQLEKDEAMLLGLQYNNNWIAFSYFNHLNGLAYYSSAADDPDVADLPSPISHFLLWNAIQYYKARNYRYFEIGWQFFGNQLFSSPSEKEIEIAGFKRGMGGKTYSLYCGTKYYNVEFLSYEINARLNCLINLLGLIPRSSASTLNVQSI